MSFQVFATQVFIRELEDASEWLYSHNEQQSVDLADQKKEQLLGEITSLKNRLSKKPFSVGTEVIKKLPTYRKAPIYTGRYQAEWLIREIQIDVSLLRFKDLKYPAEKRYKEFIFE